MQNILPSFGSDPGSVTTPYSVSPSTTDSGCPYPNGGLFNKPTSITTDGINLYVVDSGNNKVRKTNILGGNMCTIAGSGLAGALDGTGTAASFNFSLTGGGASLTGASNSSITTDGTNLYVTDSANYTIRQIVIATGAVSTLAGSGVFSPNAVDGIGTAASFPEPKGITTDGTNLYVTDANNIRKIVIATGEVSTLAGTGASGSADGIGTAASFNNPLGITTDGTNLYVAELFTYKIRKIVIATGVVSTLTPTRVSSGNMINAAGITTDGTNLYVTDLSSPRIGKIVIASGVMSDLAGNGYSSTAGAVDGIGTAASFNKPSSITSDGTKLYVADTGNNKIRKIAPAAKITGINRNAGVAGTAVAITGVNFKPVEFVPNSGNMPAPVTSLIKFNGILATIAAATNTSISTTVPVGATTGTISVITIEGGTVASADIFTVGAPTLTGMSSSTGIAGTVVTITGTNFDTTPANNTVSFNGTPATITAATATSLSVKVPVGATTGSVTVATGGGTATATSANSFTVGAPTIASRDRSTGIAGTVVTIIGTNFDITPANNTVSFNGTPAFVTNSSTATSLYVTVPVGATTGAVSVTTAGGTATAAGSFTVGAPTITGISPSTGATGTTVTITGSGFDTTPANNTVIIGGTQTTPTSATATSLTTTATNSGTVSVRTAGGTATSTVSFTVPPPPPPPPPPAPTPVSAANCPNQTYTPIGAVYDPQIDSNCQMAQYYQCMYTATGTASYLSNKNTTCAIETAFLQSLGTATCGYCP